MPVRRRTRFSSARRRRDWSWRTWPGWPGRCTRSPGRASAELMQEWTEGLAAQWAGHRAAAAEAGGHQGLWLNGDAAQGIACGAPVTPVVVGNVNPAAFGDLIRLCAQLDKLLHHPADSQPDEDQPGIDQPGIDQPGDSTPGAGNAALAPAGSTLYQEALLQAISGKAV